MFGKFVKFKGLDKRKISVLESSVVFLEEAEINGTLVTNIHLQNGRWTTAGLSLDEVQSCLELKDNDDSETKREGWRKMAISKRQIDEQISSAMINLDIKVKPESISSERMENGKCKVTMVFDDIEKTLEKATELKL